MTWANQGSATLSASLDLSQGSLDWGKVDTLGDTLGQIRHTTGPLHLSWVHLQTALPLQASNMLPVVLGPILMGSHLSSIAVWFSLALICTTVSHCGYHLPFLPSPEFHDYHHLR